MTTVREAVDLRERLAVAVGTSDLSPNGRDAQIIAALGAATMSRVFDEAKGEAAVRLTPMGTAVISPKGRLGSLLDRAKYGCDRKAEHQAAVLFAHQLARKRSWCDRLKLRAGTPLLIALAGVVVAEWVHDRCPQCGGAGTVPIERRASRNTRTKLCSRCDGLGNRRIDHSARAAALGLRMETYEAHWRARIEEAVGWIRDAEAHIVERLRFQNQRGTLRHVSD
jgi:hypothetical protein